MSKIINNGETTLIMRGIILGKMHIKEVDRLEMIYLDYPRFRYNFSNIETSLYIIGDNYAHNY